MSRTIMEEIEFLRGQIIIAKIENPVEAKIIEEAIEEEIERLQKDRGQETYSFEPLPQIAFDMEGKLIKPSISDNKKG